MSGVHSVEQNQNESINQSNDNVMNACVFLNSRTGFTVLFVYFGAFHWCFGESGCRGDRCIKPKVSWMIGRNIPLILSWVPCLLLRNALNGNNEVMFFSPFIHLDVFCRNYAVALFGGFVMKDSIQTGCYPFT